MNRLLVNFLVLFVSAISCTHLQAQERWLDVYKDGVRVMILDASKVDSITFKTTKDNDDSKLYKKPVLIEHYVGQRCLNSPTASVILSDIENSEDNVIVVNIHAGMFSYSGNGGLANECSSEYWNKWFDTNTPQPVALFNRVQTSCSPQEWQRIVNFYSEDIATTELTVSNTYDNQSNKITSTIDYVGDFSSTAKLQLWVVEDDVIAFQMTQDGGVNMDFVHHNVLRASVNGTWGESITPGVGTKNYDFEVDDAWNVNNLYLIAILYDEGTGVQQVVRTKVCEEDSYQTKLEKERTAIHDYIQRNNIKVISEEEFLANGKTTDVAQNEYVFFEGNGIYLQIVENGCGEPIANGETCSVLCRFNEWNIMGDSLQLSNTSVAFAVMPDIMNVVKHRDEVSGSFTEGLMQSFYGSTSVPLGWLIPLKYVNLGRMQTENDKLARINVIVPSSAGQHDAAERVYPTMYNLTFQKGR